MNKVSTIEKTNPSLADQLNKNLADSYALMVATQGAHWNITGPQFFGLHAAFEEQYTMLFESIDETAERIRALGFLARASLEAYSDLSNVKEGDYKNVESTLLSLVEAHENNRTAFKKTLAFAQDLGDEVTADLAITRIAWHEKTIWMLKSFLTK